MKNFFFKTKWNIIFLFVPFVLLLVIMVSGVLATLVMYNHFDTIYQNEWKEKLLTRAQTFYIQIQQTLSKKENPLPVSYIEESEDIRPTVSIPSVVLDSNGKKIGFYGSERRDYISLNEISKYFIYALLASEDRRFFSHFGVDLKRTIGVTIYIVLFGDTSRGGGSSITQQLSRYLMDWMEVSIERKAVEMLGALDLERKYSKKQILEMYCNYVPFSHGAYGVESASQTFFEKSARDLTLAEAALLVGVIPNPSKFSPFKSDKDKLQVAIDRHKRVLRLIVDTGFIPELNSYEKADKIHAEFWANNQFDKINKKAAFSIRFDPEVAYVGEQVRRELIEMSNEEYDFEKLLTEGGGLSIVTTIDSDLQKTAQRIVKEEIDLYRTDIQQNHMDGLKKSLKEWKRTLINDDNADVEVTEEDIEKALRELQGASVLINNETGEIISFIGGDGFTTTNQLIRTHQTKRQPGSSFKPLLYYSVLDTRLVDMYSVFDSPPELKISYDNGEKEWVVSNFNNSTYGRIPLTKALYKSVNTVAASLIRDLGIAPIRKNLRNILDISEKEALQRFPNGRLSLSLGTSEMTPVEMSIIYSTFARLGKGIKPYLISKVYDHKGSLLIDNEKEAKRFAEKQVLTKESVYILTRMMHKVFENNWDYGGTAARIRKLSFVPEKIKINVFDEILGTFPQNDEGKNEDREYIMKFYNKDEETGYYTIIEDTSKAEKDDLLRRFRRNTYNNDLKGWYFGKTGTTQSNRNAWLCGANDKYTLIVWVGNDNNIELFRTGGDGAGPIWARIMYETEKEYISSKIKADDIKIFRYPLKSKEELEKLEADSEEDNNSDDDTNEPKDEEILPAVIHDYTGYDLLNIPVSQITGKIPVIGITPVHYIDYDAVFYKGTEPGRFDNYQDYPELMNDPDNNIDTDNNEDDIESLLTGGDTEDESSDSDNMNDVNDYDDNEEDSTNDGNEDIEKINNGEASGENDEVIDSVLDDILGDPDKNDSNDYGNTNNNTDDGTSESGDDESIDELLDDILGEGETETED